MNSATDIVSPDVEWYCWSAEGWDSAGEGSVRDARTTTRGQAAAFFACESTGYLPDVRVWKRYVKPLTRQDVWDGPGRDRWADRYEQEHLCPLEEAFAKAPTTPPDDWRPDDYDPVWEFVHRSHPDAIPVWICGFKGDMPPSNSQPGREA